MIFLKHKKWVAILAVLALAIALPATALAADETAPVAQLYSPSDGATNAAATANQKIIFSLSEEVTLVDSVEISISGDGTTYTANANSGTVVGNAIDDRWYAVYDLSDFSSGGTPLSTLALGTTYTVYASAGAFKDLAGNASGAASGSFKTTSESGKFAVVFTTATSGQGAKVGETSIASGEAVASGVTVAFTIPSEPYYDLHTSVKIGGASGSFTLSGGQLTNDLEVYITRSQITELSGTPVISNGAYVGQALSADLSGINQPDLTGITLKWVLVDGTTEAEVATGYTIQTADLGKTIRLEVTDTMLTGTLIATSDAITRAPYTGTVEKPEKQSVTETSIELKSRAGYEYKISDGTWQDSTTFSDLTAGNSYVFVQRVKQTDTTLASSDSETTTITTLTGLTGHAVISGTAQSGKTLTGSLSSDSNGSGTLKYIWQRGGSTVGQESTYLLGDADVNQVITLYISTSDQSGTLSAATATVLRAENTTVPAAPTMASNTATSITLDAVPGYQYSVNNGSTWQSSTTFTNLVAGSTYTFVQRVAETATTLASAKSAGANFSTVAGLSGTISTTGEARYGITMTATFTGNNTGILTYTWKRGNTIAGYGTTYEVIAADIGNTLSLVVTSSVQGGSVTKSFGTVAKAYYIGEAPDAPTRSSRTTSKIVLKSVSGCEYSRGGTTWQDSTTFSGLKSGTSYTFYQRYKATATVEASEPSAAYKTSTSAASSDDDEDTSATPTPTPSTTDGSTTALYTYTLTADNTRILYSTMKSLAEGNKTQDVTIKQDNVEFTFPKGTMTQTYTQLWYDFGATINNSIAAQTAQELAGDAYVATVHYNYSGELPGKANIRLNLGVAQAGKTLYYYLLNEDNTMTFQQTTVVDTSGFATVSQTHCSDYVFLNRDINTVSASPSLSPSPDGSATPLASPSTSPDATNEGAGSDGWFIAAIILIAVALIVGGIYLYTKNREDRMDDDDDEDDNKLF